MSRYKKLTNKEKAANAKIKKELQSKGVLPKDKPKLNRKKYIESARNEWNNKDENFHAWNIFLFKSISIMLDATDRNLRVSPEAVGVAKCLKLAVRLKKFSDKLEEEGRKEYTLKEQYEFIKDILET